MITSVNSWFVDVWSSIVTVDYRLCRSPGEFIKKVNAGVLSKKLRGSVKAHGKRLLQAARVRVLKVKKRSKKSRKWEYKQKSVALCIEETGRTPDEDDLETYMDTNTDGEEEEVVNVRVLKKGERN